ncbi:uncharacterized protein LOC123306583 [Coccinella septempunctata]|uniref:uncharacterized protein LOC123306583 n=1 Tax=Coccinella septempunctata TaxID=41139 RepID=UPI001D05EA2F|nr:uncharacterized protein LOC123306583 [Coccinella septempunctata]
MYPGQDLEEKYTENEKFNLKSYTLRKNVFELSTLCCLLILFALQICSFYHIYALKNEMNEVSRNNEKLSKFVADFWNKRDKRSTYLIDHDVLIDTTTLSGFCRGVQTCTRKLKNVIATIK